MSKIKIELNQQEYKSFKQSDFPIELEGNLIILTGVNGSGKSQLLDIISGVNYIENNQNKKLYPLINFDSHSIIKTQILYKSFKEAISPTGVTGENQRVNIINQAWGWQIQGFSESSISGYVLCSKKLQQVLASSGYVYLNSDNINLENFKRHVPSDFYIYPDDVFNKSVYKLFQNYLLKVSINHRRIQEIHLEEVEVPLKKPWEELNTLFEELKFEYRFEVPKLNSDNELVNQPLLKSVLNNNFFTDSSQLSDGEKAIFSLAVASIENSLTEEGLKILLLDEYDATFNPSLTESFYKILDKFFIQKGITVILTSHSATTIALSPVYTKIYEVFRENVIGKTRIQNVGKFQYSELKIANLKFYDKIKNQKNREKELIEENAELQKEKAYLERKLVEANKANYNLIVCVTEGYNVKFLRFANKLLGFNLPVLFFDGGGKNNIKTLFFTKAETKELEFYLFDCDAISEYESCIKQKSIYKNPLIFSLTENISFAKKGIENLFNKELIGLDKERFYVSQEDDYGAVVQAFNKNEFYIFIESRNNPDDFINFRPIFETIEKIINP